MGAVDLGDLETGGEGAAGRGRELPDDVLDLVDGQLGRGRVLLVEREGARRHGVPSVRVRADRGAALPGAVRRGLAAGVGELDGRHGALRGEEAGDAAVRLHLRVVPDAEVVRGDAALRGHGGGLDDDQARAAGRAGGVVREVPVGGGAGLRALRCRRVLAHRGHPHAVRDRHIAQGEGLEERGHGGLHSSRGWCRLVR